MKGIPVFTLLALAAAVLTAGAGCGGPDFSYFESITSGPNPGATLILVWLSDSPADEAERVEVTITRVELVGPDGVQVLSTEARTVDLLTLQNGNRLKLVETEIPEGTYERLRLTLATTTPHAPTIDVGGATRPLQFRSPQGNVVEVPYTFHAPSGLRTEIQMDFNVRLSVAQDGTDWTLLPQIDAVNPEAVGSVSGRVLDPLGIPVAGAVLVAEQNGMEIRSTRTAADGTYRIALLLPGAYDISLLGPLGPTQQEQDVLVGVGLTTPLDFRN